MFQQLIKDPKVMIAVIVLVIAIISFFYSKSITGPKPVASAVAASAALQQGANNIVLSDDQGNLSSIPLSLISFKGMIVAWTGSQTDIPNGWALCDGTKGTPDLRARFLVGINIDTNLRPGHSKYNIGDQGGMEIVKLTIDEMPSHNHPIAGMQWGPGPGYRGGGNEIGGTASSSNTGGDKPHENRPPYYAVAYLMKL